MRAPAPAGAPVRLRRSPAVPRALAGFVLILMLAAAPAAAQVSAGITLQSDYRYRGRSHSDERPTVSVDLAYDHKAGLYAGETAILAATRRDGLQPIRYITYAGYAIRPGHGPAYDLGVSHHHVADFSAGKRVVNYTEVYGAILTDRVSLRLNYAQNYYNSGVDTLYADLSGALRPAKDVRIFAHAGFLEPVGGRGGRSRQDYSAGVARQLGRSEFSATWTHGDPRAGPPRPRLGHRDALVIAATYAF